MNQTLRVCSFPVAVIPPIVLVKLTSSVDILYRIHTRNCLNSTPRSVSPGSFPSADHVPVLERGDEDAAPEHVPDSRKDEERDVIKKRYRGRHDEPKEDLDVSSDRVREVEN